MLASFLGLVFMAILILGWRGLFVPVRGSRAHVIMRDGVAVLRPPRGRNAMLAGLALGPTLVVLGVVTRIGWRAADDQLGLALAFSLMALGGWLVLWLLAAEFRQHLRVDASTIERVFAVTRLQVRWSEVERIRWNPSSRWFFMVAAGAWLWVPADFDGIADFAQLALACLPQAALQGDPDARPALEELAAAPPLSPAPPHLR